ncbi:MAG TPA: hypothetical protein VM243_02845 [Phycisphaerae bacterium]|nr:hypothetical protein [Phycisphaerae bacterium]
MPSAPALPLAEMRRCASDPEFVEAVGELYAELDGEIAAHRPSCTNRGACCRFGEFGHRLFVTPVELAYFAAVTEGPAARPTTADACPYQRDGLCTTRVGRPSGCRIFFCDPAARSWQPPLTEAILARLKELHDRFNLPYVYLDWIRALGQLAGS